MCRPDVRLSRDIVSKMENRFFSAMPPFRVVYVECYFHHVGLVNAVMEKWHSHFDVDAYIYIFIPVKDSANKIPNQE